MLGHEQSNPVVRPARQSLSAAMAHFHRALPGIGEMFMARHSERAVLHKRKKHRSRSSGLAVCASCGTGFRTCRSPTFMLNFCMFIHQTKPSRQKWLSLEDRFGLRTADSVPRWKNRSKSICCWSVGGSWVGDMIDHPRSIPPKLALHLRFRTSSSTV